MSAGNVIADPGIRIGCYRVLTTTTGSWVAVDERNAPGEQTVARRKSKDAIVACITGMVGDGSPRLPGLAAEPASSTATSSPRTSRKNPEAGFALSSDVLNSRDTAISTRRTEKRKGATL